MQNFNYCTPTRLLFGRGVVERLPEVMAPLGKRVLLTYGGGSIKRSGLYDKVISLLKDHEIYELDGIEPNPKYTQSVVPGVRMCKEHKIDVILAVGGGSVLDCSKAIAAGACYDGETWDLITYKVKAQRALPIVDIMTMAATGSEYDAGGVISRPESNDKLGYIDSLLYPVCSLLDPELTFTIPPKHTLAGVADAMNHVMEQYFCEDHTILNDAMCIGALRSLITHVKRVITNPIDYESRAEIFFTCTLACNDIYSLGNSRSGWPLHAIEHTLSAYYDITHGEGLAIITPRWMRHILNERTVSRFVDYGTQLFGIDPQLPPMQVAEEAIQRTFDFFEEIGIPMSLSKVITERGHAVPSIERINEMAHHTQEVSHLDRCWAPLNEQDIAAIITASL